MNMGIFISLVAMWSYKLGTNTVTCFRRAQDLVTVGDVANEQCFAFLDALRVSSFV
jgi:hypothetical protein